MYRSSQAAELMMVKVHVLVALEELLRATEMTEARTTVLFMETVRSV